MGLMKEIDPLVDEAYRFFELMEMAKANQGHMREHGWHVSFHGSSFPGDDPYACGRKALYTMLDFPRGAFSRRSRQRMDAGKDFEIQLVKKFHLAGMLVSTPPWEQQMGFEDAEHWLTSSVDAVLLPLKSRLPRIAEIKHIDDEHVEEMIRLIRIAHPGYVRQVKCQIGMAHEAGPMKVWRCHNTGRLAIKSEQLESGEVIRLDSDEAPNGVCAQHRHPGCLIEVELLPVRHGWLYYASRNMPDLTREFYFEYDKKFMDAGRRQLAMWRQWYEEGRLPQTEFSDKRHSHPFGWKWTTEEFPCRYCDFGTNFGSGVCKVDHRMAVAQQAPINLADSSGLEDIGEIRPEYDYHETRRAVFARWGMVPPEEKEQEAA